MATEDRLGLAQFRAYLAAIARIQVVARPWLEARCDASDLVQKTLLKAHAAQDQYAGQSPGELAAWLRQILLRTLANEIRALRQVKRDIAAERSLEADLNASSCRLDAWLAADQTSPSQQAIHQERVSSLAQAIESLPADQREVVLLKHTQGLKLAEIAATLQRTPAAVAGLLRRGLQRLRELLDAEDSP